MIRATFANPERFFYNSIPLLSDMTKVEDDICQKLVDKLNFDMPFLRKRCLKEGMMLYDTSRLVKTVDTSKWIEQIKISRWFGPYTKEG